MIHIKNLSKSFFSGNETVKLFQDLNLEIPSGDFIAVFWPSGSGKSTFLNMISWIDRNYSGTISILDTEIKNLSDDQMTAFRGKHISYIFQNFKLIDNLTVEENVDLIIELNGLERNFLTSEILEIVGLGNKAKTPAFYLSGGESQRVAIARAFVGKTQILLADEPTGSLDGNNKKIIMDLILALHKQTQNTIIMITHDDAVAKIAKRVFTMANYSLIAWNARNSEKTEDTQGSSPLLNEYTTIIK